MNNSEKNYFYVAYSVDSTGTAHYNFAYTITVPEKGWGYNSECITYEINSVDYTYGTYGSYTTFSAFPVSYNNNYYVEFEVADSVTAETFSQEFLDNLICDGTGATAPTYATGYSWADFETLYNQLPDAEKNALCSSLANESGSVIEQAMARYDFIVAKYGYKNFISRSISNRSNMMEGIISTDSALMIVVVMSLLTVTFLGGWYMLKKKKEL